jgi:ATP-binding cassette subfamily F protein uup
MGLKIEDDRQTVLEFVLERYKHAHCGAVEMSVAPNEARKLLNQFEFPRQRWQTRVVYPCCLVVKSEDCSSCPS